MEFVTLRNSMMNIATSEMTEVPEKRKMVLKDIGDGGLLTVEDVEGNSIMFNFDGSVSDTDFGPQEERTDEEMIQRVKDNVETISLYFSYSFGGGPTVFRKKGDGFAADPPKKTLKNWQDAFVYNDEKEWEKRVIARLIQLDPRFPHAWIDYDSDFGYQGISLYISKRMEEISGFEVLEHAPRSAGIKFPEIKKSTGKKIVEMTPSFNILKLKTLASTSTGTVVANLASRIQTYCETVLKQNPTSRIKINWTAAPFLAPPPNPEIRAATYTYMADRGAYISVDGLGNDADSFTILIDSIGHGVSYQQRIIDL